MKRYAGSWSRSSWRRGQNETDLPHGVVGIVENDGLGLGVEEGPQLVGVQCPLRGGAGTTTLTLVLLKFQLHSLSYIRDGV